VQRCIRLLRRGSGSSRCGDELFGFGPGDVGGNGDQGLERDLDAVGGSFFVGECGGVSVDTRFSPLTVS
jgi:hypothetical protein